MPSAIDPTVPVAGNPTTASVRNNFATAANEISVLQQQTTGSPFLPLAGGRMTGALYLRNDPTDAMMPATKGYVDAGGGGGGGGIPEAPADGVTYGRNSGGWLPVLPIEGGTLTGALTLAADPTAALGAVTKQYADAIKSTILPDAPSDGASYGRSNAAWSKVLPLAGGQLTGSLSIGLPLPATLSTTSLAVIARQVVSSGPVAGNAYVDTAGAWRYLTAGAALNVSFSGNDAAIACALTGAANAAITWGPPLQIDYVGNVIVSGGPTIPTDTAFPMVSAHEYVAKANGHYVFNAYMPTPATGWKYLETGYAAYIYQDTSGTLSFGIWASAAAGSAMPANAVAGFTLNQNGMLATPGIVQGYGGLQSVSSAGNAFVGSWQTAGTTPSNAGFWNANNTLYFGNADGNNFVQTTRASMGGDGTFMTYGNIFACNKTDFGLVTYAAARYLNFANGWAFAWDSSNGNLSWQWGGNNSLFWMWRATDGLAFNSLNGVSGYGPYTNLSDVRGKMNVQPTERGLSEILKLHPVEFDRIPHSATPSLPREIGLIADDVALVIPEAVRVVGIELPDGSGGIDSDNPSLGITHDTLVAVVINAIKELATRVTTIEGRLTA